MRRPEEISTAFQPTDSLNGISEFFLVGIGGAGMSALARMLRARGFQVSGSDSARSSELIRLQQEGFDCRVGHSGDGIRLGQALIVSDAIDLAGSSEVARAAELGIPIVRRSQALGWMLRAYKVIAITGTHGKTTTTAMLGAGLEAVGLDPLVVVGASTPMWNGPVREGKGPYAVVEACEAYDSFHDLEPFSVVLTNLELDHVDYHQTYERLRSSVVRFVDSMSPEGWLVYCGDDRGACEVAELTSTQAVPYGLDKDFQKHSILINGVDLNAAELLLSGSRMALPGRHNLANAAGALTAAMTVSTDMDRVTAALKSFQGTERRLQVLEQSPITVVDDYAHHPSEVRASLTALRERYFPAPDVPGRLIVVFQPHLYSRTQGHYAEFAQALDLADHVFLTDIYPAREAPLPGVSSALIAELLEKPVNYIPSRLLLPREVARLAKAGDVVVGMGAGTIGDFAREFIQQIKRDEFLKHGRRALRVAVLYGGDSAEREVSIHSGRDARAALETFGFEVSLLDVSDLLLQGKSLAAFSGVDRPDVVFLATHGTNAEDGALQGLLELLHIPYTGSGILSSAVCMNKDFTKQALQRFGIRTPSGVLLSRPEDTATIEAPCIVKPNAQGSTVGLSFVHEQGDLGRAIAKAFAYDSQVLVEEWITGTEISTPVLCGEALEPVEIVPTSGKYDFAGKYVPGATQEIVPARIGPKLLQEAKRIAELAHQAMGCQGATRTDAIVSGDDIYVLEVNTLPGLTRTSLLPNSAAHAGIDFPELCRTLVMDALARNGPKEEAN